MSTYENASAFLRGVKTPTFLAKSLFPVQPFRSAWSTSAPFTNAPENVNFVELNDESLRSTKIASSTLRHTLVPAPPGLSNEEHAFRADYPKGSINPQGPVKGGFSFYAPGPMQHELEGAKEVILSYAVMFQDGFQFRKGGKLPGLYGGTSPETAYACSGGRSSSRSECFDLRLMWRSAGAGELYAYLPPAPHNEHLCHQGFQSECDWYGVSIGRGNWHFEPGQWAIVSERVRLNDVGEGNGEVQVFVNGESVIHSTGIMICKTGDCVFRGVHMQTFFGGSSSAWASPQDQSAYFSAFSMSIIE
ncbi:polysaccharide lyase family 14 protein [Calocera viscosa TUFC12733]|uniref:Polysaccharide lyase family 14 protein n=1 Tax=Calocera viscosa (strain TUFC12733) TaxID=1330018 RepID=A0A167GBE0_CALVF|nr:polysaccharide lyase family 14 protein [Calocera viscosa TUFC12733]